MHDRFDVWQYRDNNNCWDFVREYLKEKAGLTSMSVFTYSIMPEDKDAMNNASVEVIKNLVDCEPVDFAIACQYRGKNLFHVGVVHDGMVKHVGRKLGLVKEPIKKFERRAVTKYKIHRDLWQY